MAVLSKFTCWREGERGVVSDTGFTHCRQEITAAPAQVVGVFWGAIAATDHDIHLFLAMTDRKGARSGLHAVSRKMVTRIRLHVGAEGYSTAAQETRPCPMACGTPKALKKEHHVSLAYKLDVLRNTTSRQGGWLDQWMDGWEEKQGKAMQNTLHRRTHFPWPIPLSRCLFVVTR